MRGKRNFSGGFRGKRFPGHESKPCDDFRDIKGEANLKNTLNVYAAYFQFTTRCVIPDHDPCARCVKKNKRRCCCISLEQGIGKNSGYILEELKSVKDDLNHIRSSLDSLNLDEWKAHTSRTLVTKNVVPTIRRLGNNNDSTQSAPEMVTNAWCKMYEMLRGSQLISPAVVYSRSPPEFRTAHLCECPGGFICAVNHYLQTSSDMILPSSEPAATSPPKLSWKAVSLNPFFEGNDLNAMIDDDAFYRQTHYNWLRGEDDSGDIKKPYNISHFTREFVYPSGLQGVESLDKIKPEHFRMVDLVTADGSVDSQYDANAQECITAHLHLCEFFTALKLLAQKGHLVLKMFTLFEHHSLSIVALASCLFETVSIVKPVMSRAGSGEVYLIAKCFLGLSSALNTNLARYIATEDTLQSCLFPRYWIPQQFYDEFCNASRLFAERQTLAIKSNLK